MRLPLPVLTTGLLLLLGGAVLAAPLLPLPDTGDTADTADTADSGPSDTDDTDQPDDTDSGGPDDTDTGGETGGETAETAEDTAVYVSAAVLAGETGGCGCSSAPVPRAALGAGLWLLGLAVMRRRD